MRREILRSLCLVLFAPAVIAAQGPGLIVLNKGEATASLVSLADGRTIEGRLNSEGKARVNGIEPGTAQVSFPDRDGGEWKSV